MTLQFNLNVNLCTHSGLSELTLKFEILEQPPNIMSNGTESVNSPFYTAIAQYCRNEDPSLRCHCLFTLKKLNSIKTALHCVVL